MGEREKSGTKKHPVVGIFGFTSSLSRYAALHGTGFLLEEKALGKWSGRKFIAK
jgi:hypothetical protein